METAGSSLDSGAVETRTIAAPYHHLCHGCALPIPAARLSAIPGAILCVPCLEGAGDVPKLKRLDEVLSDGYVVETYFTDEPAIMRHIQRMNSRVADGQSFDIAVGDDANLVPELRKKVVVSAHSLASIIEPEYKESGTNITSIEAALYGTQSLQQLATAV